MQWFRVSAVVLMLLTLTACGAGRTLVVAPGEGDVRVSTMAIQSAKANVNVPDSVEQTFRNELSKKLYKSGGFSQGDQLTLRYRFIGFEEGSRLKRWLIGGLGNAGEASIVVQVGFYQAEKQLSQIQVEGKIGSGMYGGSVSSAVKKAANEAASYALQTYH